MDHGLPDDYTVRVALALAVRAPSVHNSQPWRWRVGARSIHLYVDPDLRLRETDPDGHDLMLSCGAALHHLRVAFAALGWSTTVRRLPNAAEPGHLASVELHRHEPTHDEIALAAAIPRRRTDRRRYSSWPVPRGRLAELTERVAAEGAALTAVVEPRARHDLIDAIGDAARVHAADAAYQVELVAWSGRHASTDGVPAANAPAADPLGEVTMRRFSDPRLRQPSGSADEPDESVLLVIATASDDRLSRLRAGEATSAALLTATELGLAACPLTEPLNLRDTRARVAERVLGGGSCPQMVLKIGWAGVNADPLPATPRRPLDEVVHGLTAI
ncbi:Acg family FMN-binding oxidoreductase [Amycolatopsis suaedae]|uniref:NAD(P)H nitroreductase n=1 Tax=Amycolatopsis suaedae TaxID=2510978 RepID=A0A4Q7JFF9_9PSEU|nr:NAD(P)H nitroreductase [Amycolatopsis suaedae]RZQ65922.1 NAD(P)H nitroreductase [Amycolatopsis suaedae]